MSFLKNGPSVPDSNLKPGFSLTGNTGHSFEDVLNECERSVAKGNEITEEDVEKVIRKLENYLTSQLAWEEEAIKRSGAPDLEERLFTFQLFRDKLRSFRQESRFSREALMTKIYQFSKKWFMSHILKNEPGVLK